MQVTASLVLLVCVLTVKSVNSTTNVLKLQRKAELSDVTYYFYSQTNTSGELLKSGNLNDLPATFDATKNSLFVIHGWLDKYSSESVTLIRTAVLKDHDINFIAVDWSPVGDALYLTAKNGVPDIGIFFGSFVQNLTSTYSIPLSKVAIVGHSLGAHIAGIAGSILNGEVDYIVGLDPAAPFVDSSDTDYILDPTDARFVQIIHTSGGKLGIKKPIGHADYYPNGGTDQPGCILDIFGNCAHKRSYKYFAESITNNEFYAQSCTDYKEYSTGECKGNLTLMGGYNFDKGASGSYYLKTNKESPYAMGESD